MIPAEIVEKARDVAVIQLSEWLDQQELGERFPAHLVNCTPAMVSQVSIDAALFAVYADIQAEAVLEAVRVAGNTDPRDHPFMGHDEMAEWLTRYASRLTGSTT